MAKGIEINGQMRGKRGGIVYYRAAGQQISRVRNFQPSNPRSARQSVQRMILATSSKMAAALRPIVNHSFEGVPVGNQSVQYFQGAAMRTLRGIVAQFVDAGESAPAVLAIKGAPIAAAADGVVVSKGRLAGPAFQIVAGATAAADSILLETTSGPVWSDTFIDAASYTEVLSRLSLLPGDQLTMLLYVQSPTSRAATFGTEVNMVDGYRFCRVTFKPASEVEYSGEMPLFVAGAWNPAIVESTEGEWPAMSGGTNGVTFSPAAADRVLAGATFIRSQRQEGGNYHYSSARLALNAVRVGALNFPVFESYMATSTPVEIGDNLYLQNAVAAPFTGAGQ